MAFFTLACAFHNTERLLERTLPLAVRSLTQPTRHDFEVILVADRATDEAVARLLPRLSEFGVDELRFRRTDRHSFAGLGSNNFHANNFTTVNPYLVSFTDDSFIWKSDETFDVLDAMAGIFERHPEVTLINKVDDHEEWDTPLIDVGPEIEPDVRSVNRAIDQLIAYNTRQFEPAARQFGAWERNTFNGDMGFEYQWESLATHVGRSCGRRIARPERWPLRVQHCDLRLDPGSMHGTQDEDVKLKCFDNLLRSAGLDKHS
ncbi:glycosyltransferase family A protein [Plantactinospora sp. CA-290183]|uniref:glycosyltransferase family A protein n=1 Tax=Plantactinospora sp. CA-290183 TaxID=3240006 RepID=UPI003D8A814B